MPTPDDRRGGSALLVASTGGHLQELHVLRPRLGLGRVDWATFDDPQSRSLLTGERVHHMAHTGSRDLRNALGNVPSAARLLRRHGYDTVVSTGAAIAMSVLPVARAMGLRCHYIESATRTTEPSLTGRMLERVPGVRLHTQYADWQRPRWRHDGSVFDGFAPGPPAPAQLGRVLVTLGTSRQWGFRRAVERLVQVLPASAEVVWQTGCTDVRGLGIEARPLLPADELLREMQLADVVVAHAGVGSALAALQEGRRPVLLPRRPGHAENVDDHQVLVAQELGRRGLAVHAEASELTLDHLELAAARGVVRVTAPPLDLR